MALPMATTWWLGWDKWVVPVRSAKARALGRRAPLWQAEHTFDHGDTAAVEQHAVATERAAEPPATF